MIHPRITIISKTLYFRFN